jgi:hypothetical protein
VPNSLGLMIVVGKRIYVPRKTMIPLVTIVGAFANTRSHCRCGIAVALIFKSRIKIPFLVSVS